MEERRIVRFIPVTDLSGIAEGGAAGARREVIKREGVEGR